MNIERQTSFTVYPENCNYMKIDGIPMVHGGSMLMKMDRAAAECARRLLYGNECDSARTVGVDKIAFTSGAKLGDILNIHCRVVSVGIKQIRIFVEVFKDENNESMANGEFTFCSFKGQLPHPHGIKNEYIALWNM